VDKSQKPWPREWLMTDERIGERLWEALAHVPAGTGGVVLRHYGLGVADRERLGHEVASIARARGLMLAVGRDERLAHRLGASLVHNPARAVGGLPFSLSVHDERQAQAARAAGAALVFVSPVYPTRSHPERPALGVDEAIRLAAIAGCPAIALGGMDELRFHRLDAAFHGYAGIDCWLDEPSIERMP